MDELERAGHELRLLQRQTYGRWLLALLIAQLAAANALMFMYAGWGHGWKVPNDVMKGWLGAAVVQLIGLVYVVVSHLFPRNGE